MRGLTGKTAVVTGGATLIGAAVVLAFVERGANVAVADIDEGGGRALAEYAGGRVFFSATDIRGDPMRKIVIVGGGQAGLSSASASCRAATT
jgi:NAD(P)-dependent dehydrogenase (short-subunit alcohol dehydrogenase family)